MADITTKMITDLRTKTSAGMMDCKAALTECDGNFENAIDWLRKKGLVKAGKKADRIAAAGVVAYEIQGDKGAIIELNCETDFVAKNPEFQKLALDCAKKALEINTLEAAQDAMKEEIGAAVGSIGENIQLRRAAFISAPVIVSYIHTAIADKMGKIVVLVGMEGDKEKCEEIGKKIAMHIAASKPDFLCKENVCPTVIEKEKAFQREQALSSGKPAEIVEKMLEGRIAKFYEEICLVEQPFVMDPAKKVKDVCEGCKIVDYKMLVLGEGVEKKEDNLGAEIASMIA